MEFNVSEQWLRTGEGNMFIEATQEEIDRLAECYKLPPWAKKFVKSFVNLGENEMRAISGFVKEIFSERNEAETEKADIDEDI